MLRKALWTMVYAGFGAAATMLARRVATTIWLATTHEQPPEKQ